MRIIFVDDEPSAHMNFLNYMKDRDDITSLMCFINAKDALNYAKNNEMDCAFLDIDFNGEVEGISLATKLKEISPNIEIAFLTASLEHAITSYKIGGRAYLLKPYTKNELFEALDLLKGLVFLHKNSLDTKNKIDIRVRTFVNFDLFVNNSPVAFKNKKSKEIFAFLVHQKGGTVKCSEIFLAVWENQEYTSNTSTYVRRTLKALKSELDTLGIGHIFISERNSYSLNISEFSCDYYDLLNGSKLEASHFGGEYMKQYSWGEESIYFIERRAEMLLEQ